MTIFPVEGAFPPPREFQSHAHNALRQGFRDGHRCQMLMSPTGSGKTYLGLRVAKEALEKGKRAVFVCDRTVLINQTSETADRYGLHDHGIIQADHWRSNNSYFQIASAQTLSARKIRPKADVVIVDEAHTQLKAWTDWIKESDCAFIGLSATPFSEGLGTLFTNLVNAATMADLVDMGVLVPMRVFTCTKPDMKGAKVVAGEWSDAEAEKRGMQIVGDVVTEWIKYGDNRKTIVFGATIAHCEEIVRQFNAAGIKAALFTSHTTFSERAELLADFKRDDATLKVLCSVEALAKGFDVPAVSCVVDCRPLRKSLSTAIQMWGRGLRSAPGKTDCIILDHSGNIVRFKKDFERIYHEGLDRLDDGEKMDREIRKDDEEVEKSSCPSCGYTPFFRKCMQCGHEYKPQSMIEHVAGEMQEIVVGKTRYADNARHLWEQTGSYALKHSAPDKQLGRARALFKEIAGRWPPSSWRLPDAPVVITPEVANKIKSRNIAYIRGRMRHAA